MREKSLNLKTDKFKVYEGVLYRTETILGCEINKLALPTNFAEQCIFNSHYTQAQHMSAQSHCDIFNANFYVKNCLGLAQQIISKCLTCNLNSRNYNRKTSGTSRQDKMNPGHTFTWIAYT